MRRKFFLVISIVFLLCLPMTISATEITLGNKDLNDGVVYSLSHFNSVSSDESAPFDQAYGSDLSTGSNFDETWTFSYAASPVVDASIEFGLIDYDFFNSLDSVVSLFSVDGMDLTTQLNNAISAKGVVSGNAEYNIFTIDLASALSELNDGTAVFSLALQPQASSGQVSNGAGIDFAKLTMNQNPVPEPVTFMLFGIGLIGIAGVSRKKK